MAFCQSLATQRFRPRQAAILSLSLTMELVSLGIAEKALPDSAWPREPKVMGSAQAERSFETAERTVAKPRQSTQQPEQRWNIKLTGSGWLGEHGS
jgi:hypothetical protein